MYLPPLIFSRTFTRLSPSKFCLTTAKLRVVTKKRFWNWRVQFIVFWHFSKWRPVVVLLFHEKKNMDPSSKPMKYLAILQIKPAKFFSLHEAGKYNMVRIFSCTYVVVHCNDFSKYVYVFGKLLRNFYFLEIIDI